MNISAIDYESITEAEGVSCVIYISGCRHNCYMCHSPKTHDFNYGTPVSDKLIDTINKEIDKRPFLNSLVLCGGDPMYSALEICDMLDKLHIPNNNIWCYSGFTLSEIINNKNMKALLNKCNVLIDGKFIFEERDITLPFRGSENQKIWLKEDNKWILYNKYN